MRHTIERMRQQEGATAVEYGIMVALIAIVIIGAVLLLGQNLDATFQEVAEEIGNTTEGTEGTEG
jgi:pilus assembly protein Flp/PilA